ncbi:MAG: BspA family leucine-rich repeat surface protein, partial [Ruminococcus sp.]|uniref:BspA family leucine-rich repeat surface protein n=1 Tax=Ruminococcus sp. TaxID=41978 RepID=UPI001B2F5772
MKNKLIKKITAAAMAFSLVGGAVSVPVDDKTIFTAKAENDLDNKLVTPEKEPTATYDAERNILTISGNVDRSTFGGYVNYNDLTIIADSETVLPEDSSGLFMWFSAKTIDLSNADTSNVKDMNNMFQGCQNLQSVDLGYLNTNNVTDMHEMFSGCNNLESIDMTDFDTSNVERMDSMFFCCSSLKSLDLGSFDTANVTSMAF